MLFPCFVKPDRQVESVFIKKHWESENKHGIGKRTRNTKIGSVLRSSRMLIQYDRNSLHNNIGQIYGLKKKTSSHFYNPLVKNIPTYGFMK